MNFATRGQTQQVDDDPSEHNGVGVEPGHVPR